MNKPLVIFIILFVLAVGSAYVFTRENTPPAPDASSPPTKSTTQTVPANVQQVTLSYRNYNYYPQTVRVKEGQPVRISLDNSVKGCYRTFTLRDFGVSKYLKSPQEYVEFTPQKKGTFTFACSMGMGTGTLIVE